MSRLFDAPVWHLVRTLAMGEFFVNFSDLNAKGLRTRQRAIPGYAARAMMREIDHLNAELIAFEERAREAERQLWTLERAGRTVPPGA